MPVFGVTRDPSPLSLSFKSIVMDDPAYMTSAFDAYVDTSKNYAAWSVVSFVRPIMGDVPMSRGGVLVGITRA